MLPGGRCCIGSHPDNTSLDGRSQAPPPDLMPVLFVGHGSPLNAVEDNDFSREWERVGQTLPRPRAIVCFSAHWETAGTCVTAMAQPDTLYDFHGFPRRLYKLTYAAPGAPDLARSIKQVLKEVTLHLAFGWGLDHGVWSVLCRMFPNADIPVLQISLDFDQPPAFHYALGQALKYLRRDGVLVIGSGNMVHNLRTMVWEDTAFEWAREFDARLVERIQAGDHPALIDYQAIGEDPHLAIPTPEHYLPLLYVLAMQDPADRISFFCDRITLGSVSMRSFTLSA